MKKLIFIAFALFLSVSAKGQNKIDGIGRIKLGMSFEQVCEIVQYEMEVKNHNWQVEDVKKFQVKNYEPVEGYYLKGVILWFYKNQLYEIEIDSNQSGDTNIDKALTIKYGEPKIEIKEEPIVFQNGFGATTTKTKISTFKEWKTNTPNIKCNYAHCVSHTAIRGEIHTFSVQTFSLKNFKIWEIVYDLDEKNESQAKQAEEERLKKLLEAL